MELLRRYLRARRRAIVLAAVCCAVFGVTFALYHLPLPAVLYPAGLCALLAAAFAGRDLARTAKTHRTLQALTARAAESADLAAALAGALPAAEDVAGQDYQALIAALQQQLAAQSAHSALRARDMSDYCTAWAHQIKTPIAAMRLILQSEDTPLSRRLEAEVFRIEQYVEMVLAFVRLGSADTDYVLCTCALDEVLRRAVKRFAASFIDRHVRLDFVPTGRTLVSDEKWLGFVVEQLLSNALKYTPDGGCVTVAPAGESELCIADTGIGIAPEDLPRVFDKGYTGCNGRRDAGRHATGLGLYLCRRVCQNLGIGIRIESAPGQGTRVYLDLAQYDLKAE